MFCNKCGQELPEGAAFCNGCGSATNGAAVAHANGQPIIVNVSNVNSNTNTLGGHGAYPYRSKWTAFFLCLFLGVFGIHRFYVGKSFTGIVWLFTGGFFGIGAIIDLLLILFGSFRDKAGYPLR